MTVAPTPVHDHRALQRAGAFLVAFFLAVAVLLAFALLRPEGRSSTGLEGSGNVVSEARQVAPFSEVELAGSNHVTVRAGVARSLVVRADDNLLGHVTTAVHAGRLVIGNTPGSFSTTSRLEVAVTVPSVDVIVLRGSGSVDVDGVAGERLTIRVPGSGIVRVRGRVARLDVGLSGSGDVQLGGLTATSARAAVGGSGVIRLVATDSLDATVSGSGAIVYGGDPPHVLSSVTGSGTITRG